MIRNRLLWACIALGCLLGQSANAQPASTAPVQQGDVVLRDFRFVSGETLPQLKLHYRTLGTPRRDASGKVVNAVLILHGTGGDGGQFLRPQFAEVLFAPGGLLDPARYYIVLPDSIGHGASSKPSDGLRARFPQYDYDDMVRAQHALLAELGVERLRLILGTSMGCMHAFVWGETWPDAADALMPLACLPNQIAGRNRMWRKMAMDAIRADPAWTGGDYEAQPQMGLRAASNLLTIAGSVPLQMQASAPTRDAADKALDERLQSDLKSLDANDFLYAVNASRNYDPSPKLETITAPVMWINTADDFINPPELGIAEQQAKRLKRGTFVLLPVSDATRGHGSHTWAVLWQDRLKQLLEAPERR